MEEDITASIEKVAVMNGGSQVVHLDLFSWHLFSEIASENSSDVEGIGFLTGFGINYNFVRKH